MTSFTRLTLVGSTRRADVVVPSDEGLAALLPRLLEIVEEAPRLQPATTALVRATGEQVDLALDAATQQLADGEVLRVVRAAAAPPSPEVADVTDVASEELAARADRWDVDVRQRVAAAAAGVATAAAGTVLAPEVPGPVLAAGAAGAALAVAGVAVTLGRSGRRHPARVLTATGLGAAAVVAVALAQDAGTGAAALTALAVAWLVLAAGAGWARRDRGALAGAGAGAVLTGAHVALGALLPADVAAAVVAALALLVLGLLPGYAMTAAGLTAIDDAVLDGALPARERVRRSLDDAYRGLSWSAAAVAITLTVACSVLLTSHGPGAVALGVVAVAVTALRTRSMPLAVQGIVLWSAVAVPLVLGVVLAWGPAAPVVTAGAVVVAVLVLAAASALRPSGQQRARWRRTGDVVELLLVLAVLPLLLGVMGVYGELLEVF